MFTIDEVSIIKMYIDNGNKSKKEVITQLLAASEQMSEGTNESKQIKKTIDRLIEKLQNTDEQTFEKINLSDALVIE